ncbi:MAG TPA: ribonuclease III [Terracidiphilus sp.]|nr:ribonuclease III [Terracidiphilus sp.]
MVEQPAVEQLEMALGHTFACPEVLVRALTHRSLARQIAHQNGGESAAVPHNERLEFLGDAVLNLVVAEALFSLHPEWQEGELTRVRARLVSRQHMAQVAGAIGLGDYLRLSKNEERSGLRRKSTVLSDSMEAVMGALFLDGGLEPVRAFARRRIMGEAVAELAEQLRSGAALGNYKSALQERLQAIHAGTPEYRVKSESGPPHRRQFVVEVRLKTAAGVSGEPLASGWGRTKKRAEQDAARRALDRLPASELPAKSEANLPAGGALEGKQEESASP